jgi:hypothetical protein
LAVHLAPEDKASASIESFRIKRQISTRRLDVPESRDASFADMTRVRYGDFSVGPGIPRQHRE